MDTQNLCRCCLAKGLHKNLNKTYVWLNKKEVYSTMLRDCFNIVLSKSLECNGICDKCVSALRAAVAFKEGVLDAEKEFLIRMPELHSDKKVVIKLEPKEDSAGDDSDDYFLADTVREEPVSKIKIKKEPEPEKKKPQKRSRSSATMKAGKSDGWGDDVKELVSKLTSIGNNELTVKKKKGSVINTKTRKLKIAPDAFEKTKVHFVWTSRMNLEKVKHKENLLTLLQYSNIVPFKNKVALGYSCGYCDSTHADPQDLRIHTETEHKKDRLNFKTNLDFTEYNVKVDITDLTCTLCEEKKENLGALRDHLVKVHKKIYHTDVKDYIIQFRLKKGDVYDCVMCSATYETFKMLKQHMNKHYSNYSCTLCDSTYTTRRSLNVHRTTHLDGSFKCDFCDKSFPSLAKKQYHLKTKHYGTRNISNCPYCNETFRSYYQRNQHYVKVHNSEAKYKCNICSKSYLLKSLLTTHIKKTHLMERNAQCSECGYRFFSKKALKAHMVKHTGERNYTCTVCNKAYARKYTLREHMRIHNNDRRFKCEVCAMTFVQKCSLKSHLLSNHGISIPASEIVRVDAESKKESEAKSQEISTQ